MNTLVESSSAIRACPACGRPGAIPDGSENGWRIALCTQCLVRFTVEVPNAQELQEIYNRLYSDGDAYEMHLEEVRRVKETGRNRPGIYRSKIFLDRYRPEPGDRLLEVGCGIGTFMMNAQSKGWEVEGIDLSEEAVTASRQIHQLPVRIGSFFEITFEPAAYAAIVTWEVLEHLPDAKAFLDKARLLLRPGGVLACSVPNEGRKVPHPPVRGPASVPPVHLNFWDREALTRFFEANGYKVERVLTQRTMLSLADPREHPLRYLRLQAGAFSGSYEGIHLYATAVPDS